MIAGTTGSGKSVALNSMLMSILYKATARSSISLIDPKMLELSVYEDLPHLLCPVIKHGSSCLGLEMVSMKWRGDILMAALSVRNLNGFNSKVKETNLVSQ